MPRKSRREPMLTYEDFIKECVEHVSIRAHENFIWKLEWLAKKSESPIEKRLLAGMLCHLAGGIVGRVIYADLPNPPWERDGDVEIHLQKQIGDYRVDFCIDVRNACQIVVECDGHDFHERTKEQARRDKSRDRWFVSQGIRVVRFTGSEIYRNTEECVDEISALIEAEQDRDSKTKIALVGPK